MSGGADGPPIDPARVIADLRALERATGGEGGARRLCWDQEWRDARDLFGELLGEIGLTPERDEAGNVWAYLEGDAEPALGVGSHLDSVPAGGWLDGALGAMAALGVVRAWAESGRRPPRTVALVDFADEEGARFGRSLFGSSAVAGTLDPARLEGLHDGDGRGLPEVLAANGVELADAPAAASRRERLGAFLELHIEQGPVLEAERLSAAAVRGCVGVERHRVWFEGQASHAGTTPMDRRRDAGLAAAETMQAIERLPRGEAAVATTGGLTLHPGVATAVAGSAELLVDLRAPGAGDLAEMLEAALAAAGSAAGERGCSHRSERIWGIEPIAFDPRLVAAAAESCLEVAGTDRTITSGALHDAAEIAKVIPAAMLFSPSIGGISHASNEDTSEDDLAVAIEAFGAFANRALELG